MRFNFFVLSNEIFKEIIDFMEELFLSRRLIYRVSGKIRRINSFRITWTKQFFCGLSNKWC